LTKLMDENALLAEPKDVRAVTRGPWCNRRCCRRRVPRRSAAQEPQILSAKVSAVQDLSRSADACRTLVRHHLGLTEAGMGSKGIVASSAALASCCSRASAIPSGFR
jgi:(E)-4-hydroxy-3-methylbut-2-enyl-diphosphate synthase